MGLADDFIELDLDRCAVTVLGALNQKHHRKVTTVVPVSMTICQVSEEPNSGPLTAQMATAAAASENATAGPQAWAAAFMNSAKA